MRYLLLAIALLVASPAHADEAAEVECLAQNIYFEARDQSQEGMVAVGYVAMNRVRSSKYPSTVCEVVRQHHRPGRRGGCQFSWWCDGKSDTPREHGAYDDAKAIAVAVYHSLMTDPTGGALWYHADYSKPVWRTRLVVATKIGDHIFYTD